MYSSYPEDTPDTLLSRIEEAKVKWILCDPKSVDSAKEAAAQAEWFVEIIVFTKDEDPLLADADLEGCTNADEIFNDDGAGKERIHAAEKQKKISLISCFLLQ